MNDFSVIATLQKNEGHNDSPQQTIQEEQKNTIILFREKLYFVFSLKKVCAGAHFYFLKTAISN